MQRFALPPTFCSETRGFQHGFQRVPNFSRSHNYDPRLCLGRFGRRVPSGFLRVPALPLALALGSVAKRADADAGSSGLQRVPAGSNIIEARMVAGADQVPAGADAAGRTAVLGSAARRAGSDAVPAFPSGFQRVPAGSDICAFAQLCSAQWPGALLVAGSDQVPAGSDAATRTAALCRGGVAFTVVV